MPRIPSPRTVECTPNCLRTASAEAALPACKGRQDQNAGHRSLASDRGGFGVSNFPDTQNVGILSQHTAKCRSECKPCFALYLNLIGSGQQPLNRIFDCDQAAICANSILSVD